MKYIRLLLGGLFSLGLCCCAGITSEYCLRQDTDAFLIQELEGKWLFRSDTLSISFNNDGIGTITSSYPQIEGSEFSELSVTISTGMEYNFLCIRLKQEDTWQAKYFFARYDRPEHGELKIFLPKLQPFKTAIKEEELEGNIIAENQIHIRTNPDELLNYLDDHGKKLFDQKNVITLRRGDQ